MKYPKNVTDFLSKSSDLVGRLKSENFSQITFCQLDEFDSPIEQIFYIATLAMAEYHSLNPRLIKDSSAAEPDSYWLNIYPQKQIGNYRVDFLMTCLVLGNNDNDVLKKVVIELDGHDFHDKDKKQRAYEKSRDRYLSRQGFSVLHFTGSEIVKNPYKAVLETFIMLSIAEEEYLADHDENNPFGVD